MLQSYVACFKFILISAEGKKGKNPKKRRLQLLGPANKRPKGMSR